MVKFIFITGTFRSSTTLTSRILNAHPDVQVYSDLSVYSRFHSLDNQNYKEKEREIKNRILLRRNERLKDNNENNYISSVDHWINILNRLESRNSKPIVGEKCVLEWHNIPSILNHPHTATIHTIRDPRSVLVSWKKMTNAPLPKYLDALANCLNSMIHGLLYMKEFSENRYIPFIYEKFVENPEEYILDIQQKLNLKSNLDCLNNNNWTLDGKKYSSSSMHGKISDKSQAKARSWKNYITPLEEYIFNTYFPDWILKAYGFEEKRTTVEIDIEEVSKIMKDKFINESFDSLNNTGLRRFPSDFRDPKTWMKPFFE